jgi:low temperature requirement protein LtrA
VEGKHASWLELFYDLLFVALVAQLAHGFVAQPGFAGAATVVGFFLPAWWVWVSFTVFSNVAGSDRPAHRVTVLANMACLLVMAAGISQALHGHPALFAAGYALSRFVRVVPWVLAVRREGGWPPLREATPYVVSAVLWAISVVVPTPWCYLLWTVGLVLEILPGLGFVGAGRALPVDPPHLVERFGLFAIIALGEGIAQIVASMAGDHIDFLVIADGVAGFALIAVLWWLYFDFASGAAEVSLRTDAGRTRRIVIGGFVVGHFTIVAGIMAIAAGLGQVITADGAHADHVLGIRLACVGLACYLTNNAVLALSVVPVCWTRVLTWYVPAAVALVVGWFGAAWSAPLVLGMLAVVLAGASAVSSARVRRPASGRRPAATRP